MSWVAASVLCCYWLLWEISLCLDAQQARPLQQAHFILNLKHMGQPTFCLFCDLMVGVSCYYHEMYLSTPHHPNTKNDRNLSLSIWDYSYATKNAFKSWLRLLSLTWSLLIVSLELLVSGCWVVACLAGIAVHHQMPKPDHTLPPGILELLELHVTSSALLSAVQELETVIRALVPFLLPAKEIWFLFFGFFSSAYFCLYLVI